ncbi:glycine--tRNA ligase subunit beta, partial [Ectothiorhodospira haloalkaliphila]
MSDAQDLLIEIGTEELPPKALRELRDAFAREVTRGLEEAGFKVGAGQAYAAPRRLAVWIREVPLRQADQ